LAPVLLQYSVCVPIVLICIAPKDGHIL
jgi:hypothetical protein